MSAVVPLPITPPPGIVATESKRASEGRFTLPHHWWGFRNGKAYTMMGWVQAVSTPTSGTPRATLGWSDLVLNNYIAVGTYRKLYAYDIGLNQNDITPIRISGALTNPFSTTVGLSVIVVAHTSHGVGAGDQVINDSVGAAVGGITALQLTGSFVVTQVDSPNQYRFDSGVVAGSTAGPGGGTVNYRYEIGIGSELAAGGYGWGVGPWGLGTWGTARATTTITIEPRVWGLDNFGKILLAANAPEGSLYSFDPTASQPWPRAVIVSAAPTTIRQIVVTPEQFVFALCDGLVVNSCSQGDYTTWTPATSNTAFSRTLTVGSKLVAGRVLGPFVTLLWTDSALYKFQYSGSQFVYESSLEGRDCGLVGPSAAVTIGGVAYWMGPDNFWMYSGGAPVPMPNVEDIRKYVYDQANIQNGYQFAAVYNPTTDSIWFEITVAGQVNPSLLVIFHRSEQIWTRHDMTRVSGFHFSQGDTRPYLWDANGYLYQHENTFDGNGSAITRTLTMAPYALGGVQSGAMQSMDIEGIRFDTKDQVGDLSLTINTWDEINDTVVQDTETETISAPGGSMQDLRLSGRYAGMTMVMSGLGCYARLGATVAYARPTAKRRAG